ncbi:MAG: hypothetical protein ACI89L_001725 [Phycisphaerales bacterium]|jgi:hypothetical protein
MSRSLGWAMVLLGAALGGTALVLAVLELGQIYQEATDDPMGLHSPEPQGRARTMLTYAMLGIPGMLLSTGGFVVLIVAKSRKRRVQ